MVGTWNAAVTFLTWVPGGVAALKPHQSGWGEDVVNEVSMVFRACSQRIGRVAYGLLRPRETDR
jgi:hypothetical protein